MNTNLHIILNKVDVFTDLRDTAENAARNLGFTLDLPQLSPELWQKVLLATELQMRIRSIELVSDWREKLAGQIWRPPGKDGTQFTDWLTPFKDLHQQSKRASGLALDVVEPEYSGASDGHRI